MTKLTKLIVAFAVGVIFPLIFFLFNDADRSPLSVIVGWFSIVLIPAASVICAMSKRTFLLNATTVVIMLSGIFVGTCAAIIFYSPDKANIFPIAAAIWTIIVTVPVVLGSVLGPLVIKIYEHTA